MEIIYEKKSPHSLEETIKRLKLALSEVGFGVLWELNFKDKLAEKGFELEPNFYVFEVCNPSKAEKVLKEWLMAGYFLPCKMAAYEKVGEVYVGLPKPVDLITLVSNDDLLKSFAEEVEDALTEVIEKVTHQGPIL